MAVLSQMAYYEINTSPNDPRSLFEIIEEIENNPQFRESLGKDLCKVLDALKEKVKDKDYFVIYAVDDKEDTGFAAFAVKDPDNEVTIACRGTEGNFNPFNEDFRKDGYTDLQIGIFEETNQQQKLEEFIEYLELIGNYDGFYFTGHSLGGNLAVHGAVSCSNPSKVKGVVVFNAPGFNIRYLTVHGIKIDQLKNKIFNYDNEYDYVSSLLFSPGHKVVIDSSQSFFDFGFSHHSLCELKINESGHFVKTGHKGLRSELPVRLSLIPNTIWIRNTAERYLRHKFFGSTLTGFRDFSESALSLFTSAAQEVEDEEWWNVTRWDCWYRMDRFFGSHIMNFQLLCGNVDTYYRKLIDLNDASVADIEEIFRKVYQIDTSYSSNVDSQNDLLERNVLNKLIRLKDSISPQTY